MEMSESEANEFSKCNFSLMAEKIHGMSVALLDENKKRTSPRRARVTYT